MCFCCVFVFYSRVVSLRAPRQTPIHVVIETAVNDRIFSPPAAGLLLIYLRDVHICSAGNGFGGFEDPQTSQLTESHNPTLYTYKHDTALKLRQLSLSLSLFLFITVPSATYDIAKTTDWIFDGIKHLKMYAGRVQVPETKPDL